MKIGERFRGSLESSIESKLLTREEGIIALNNLIDELNGVTKVKFSSDYFDRILSISQLNLNQVSEKVKNALGLIMGIAIYKEYDPTEEKGDWTHNPCYQVTKLLQFLRKTLQNEDSSKNFEDTIKNLNKFMADNTISLELILTNIVEEAINIVFDVFFLEELEQKNNLEIMSLLILPESFARKVVSIIGEK